MSLCSCIANEQPPELTQEMKGSSVNIQSYAYTMPIINTIELCRFKLFRVV